MNDNSCSKTCTTSKMCVKVHMMVKQKEITAQHCEDQIQQYNKQANCKALSNVSGTGCVTVGAGDQKIEVCCCDGDRCNGGNFQNGSVFMILFTALVGRFF